MKNASLLLSTALASLIVLAPATFVSADAATIKIKPQVVKVKPKIAVAKPSVRVKVKPRIAVAKPKVRVRVKPKIAVAKPKLQPKIKAASIKPRVKIQAAAPKIVTTLKATPKIAAPALNIKPRINAQAVAKAIAKVKPVAIIKPQVKVASNPPKATIRQTGAAAVVDRVVIPSGISDAAQGARAAAAARDALKLGAIGAAVATGKLGSELGGFSVPGKTVPSNNDVVGGFIKEPKGGSGGAPGLDGKWGNHGVGNINADNFVGLPNTHSPAGTDPNTAAGGAMAYWNGKRDGGLAGAIAGVAGTRNSDGNTTVDEGSEGMVSWHTSKDMDTGLVTFSKTEDVFSRSGDRYLGQLETHRTMDSRGTRTSGFTLRPTSGDQRTTTNIHAPGSGIILKRFDSGIEPDQTTGRRSPNRLPVGPTTPHWRTDPEYSNGGSTPFWWINEREKGTFDFSKVGSGGKSPGAMPDAPHGEDGMPRSQRVVSQNDVLERYDEENRGGGTPTPIDPDGENQY